MMIATNACEVVRMEDVKQHGTWHPQSKGITWSTWVDDLSYGGPNFSDVESSFHDLEGTSYQHLQTEKAGRRKHWRLQAMKLG
jgi:hypothetical protein